LAGTGGLSGARTSWCAGSGLTAITSSIGSHKSSARREPGATDSRWHRPQRISLSQRPCFHDLTIERSPATVLTPSLDVFDAVGGAGGGGRGGAARVGLVVDGANRSSTWMVWTQSSPKS
jgi:hypothetical protein